jgi:hypothetical protein
MPAVSVTKGCDLLATWARQESGERGFCYLVPSAAGGRLFRKQGIRGFLEGVDPWACAAGIDPSTARVVSALPPSPSGTAPHWPPLRPAFPEPRREGATLRFRFDVPFELAIFRGHFPTVPIVPGALLTGWVTEIGREHGGWQHGASYATMLKFRRIVQPGLTYDLQIEISGERSTLDFHIQLDGATCALGTLSAGPA